MNTEDTVEKTLEKSAFDFYRLMASTVTEQDKQAAEAMIAVAKSRKREEAAAKKDTN